MVMHEYFHGFQFKNDGYLETYETITNTVLPDTLIALAACHGWYKESITQENDLLLKAIDASDIEASRAYIQSFFESWSSCMKRWKVLLAISNIVCIGILETSACPMPNGYILLDADITMPRDSISSAYQTSWRLIINTGYLKTCQS